MEPVLASETAVRFAIDRYYSSSPVIEPEQMSEGLSAEGTAHSAESSEMASRLTKLRGLLEADVITKDEYSARKREILAEI